MCIKLDIYSRSNGRLYFSEFNDGANGEKGIRCYSGIIGRILTFFGKAIAIQTEKFSLGGGNPLYLNKNSLLNRYGTNGIQSKDTAIKCFEANPSAYIHKFFDNMRKLHKIMCKVFGSESSKPDGYNGLSQGDMDFYCLEKRHINTPDGLGDTPLHTTCKKRHLKLAQKLISTGANVHIINNEGRTPLHLACQKGHIQLTTSLIRKAADINTTDLRGKTPLHLACEFGHTDAAVALIEVGANVHLKDKQGKTPFHSAYVNNNTEIMRALTQAGAHASAPITDRLENKDLTPLQLACRFGHTDTVRALLEKGVTK